MSRLEAGVESSLRNVAKMAADQVQDGAILGLGSGSAVALFAKSLGEQIADKKIRNITAVPSSMQAWSLAKEYAIPLHEDSAHCPPKIDLAVDGADQVAISSRSMIKGGGGALLKEKIILSSARRSLILIDSSKLVQKLSRSVPVELIQFGVETTGEKIRSLFESEATLRKLDKGYPFVTEAGNLILDVQMPQAIQDPLKTERAIKALPGVVEVGIFNLPVDKFYVARPDGSMESV
jgi:ribose 5-phosphate isomerase A